MIRATYADLQPQLARISGASGMIVGDARVLAYTNLATQELMDEADWPQLIVRMRFKVTNQRINVPSEFDRILMLTINGVPLPMQSPWFEFVGYGPQLLNGGFGAEVAPINELDQGLLGRLEGVLDKEQVATFEDIPSDGNLYYPTVYATASEIVNGVSPSITLCGYDNNGQWIRTNDPTNGWMDGVNVIIDGENPPYSSASPQAFSHITEILKPVTNGYLSLYVNGWGGIGQQNVFLCSYAPYDTRPYYRRYRIPNLSCTQTYCVEARLRKRFTPIVNVNDFLLIPNLPALSTMVQAVYFREAQDIQSYAAYKAIAVGILQKEMTAYIGKQRQKPLITVNEGFGVRMDGNYIL